LCKEGKRKGTGKVKGREGRKMKGKGKAEKQ
jgi:hypothetical protein